MHVHIQKKKLIIQLIQRSMIIMVINNNVDFSIFLIFIILMITPLSH